MRADSEFFGPGWPLLGVLVSAASAQRIAAVCTADRRPARAVTVACANLHSLATASRDGDFLQALAGFDCVTADGAPLRVAGRVLGESVGPRVTGYEVFEHVMEALEARSGRAYFLGSTVPVLAAIKARAQREYPRVQVGVQSPPFADLSGTPSAAIAAAVNEFRPDVVFVGMSAPKQEKWTARHAAALDTGAVICVGAVFDYYAGSLRRAPSWLRRSGGEWLFRLLQEPRRVWRKYFVSGPIFARLVWRAWRLRQDRRAA